MNIQPLTPQDRDWVRPMIEAIFGSAQVVSRGKLHQADALPGFHADQHGVITYEIVDDACEVVALVNGERGKGIGRALLDAVHAEAQAHGCRRLWLVTTNDNMQALRFYQKYGFQLIALHRDALDESRKLKPEIPATGEDDIPIRDELELEILLQ